MSQGNTVNRDELVAELSQAVAHANEQLRTVLSENSSERDNASALADYLLHLRTLAEAGDTLDLSALSVVVRFVAANTESFQGNVAELKANTDVCELLLGWENSLIPCLASAVNEEDIGALLILLQQPAWPVAIDEEAIMGVAETLLALSQQAQESETGNEASSSAAHNDGSLGIDIQDSASQVLDFADDLNPDLKEAFMAEVPDRASRLTEIVVSLSQGDDADQSDPAAQVESLNEAQRHAHTIKGSANITGVYGLANITHVLEDILEHFVNVGGGVDSSTTALLVDACDFVSMEIDHLSGYGELPNNLVGLVENLLAHRQTLYAPNDDPSESVRTSGSVQQATESTDSAQDNTESSASSTVSTNSTGRSGSTKTSARVSLAVDAMDRVLNDAGEVSIATVQLATYRDSLKYDLKQILEQQTLTHSKLTDLEQQLLSINTTPAVRPRKKKKAVKSASLIPGPSDSMDSLELDEYSEFHSSLSVLTENVTDVLQMLTEMTSGVQRFDDLLLHQDRVSRELTDLLMSTRMVTPASIIGRLERIVRQTCRSTSKKARLLVTGEDIDLDNEALSVVIDPLMHILRNGIDHGIETPEERLRIGKAEEGTIIVAFVREGDEVEIRCSDDGKGFDYQKIRDKAIKLGHIQPDQQTDDSELARFTLLPGFSTAEQVTQVSGRGVGMDVVAQQITAYRGQIDVQSVPGRGTSISMRLPLQMLSMHVLLVEEGQGTYALPSAAVNQLIFSDFGEFKHGDHASQVFIFNKQRYEVMSLWQLLGVSARKDGQQNYSFDNAVPLLLVAADNRRVAIVVEKPLNNERLVVKTPPSYMPRLPGFIGGAIRGDGTVAPVIDLRELIRLGAGGGVQSEGFSLPAATEEAQRKILVVDDSLSARRSLADLVSDLGYDTRTAVDGLDAAEILEHWPADMVFTDLEMPRMNGLQLARHLRHESATRELPIVMVTSRSANKHRKLAEESGVSRYLTKPFDEDEVMDCLTSILQSSDVA